jgi:hypothetical protein
VPAYSPVLAIVTGVLEVAAVVYALSGPGRKRILRPVGAILLFLAGYQFAEVAVCARPAVPLFSRLAYLVITWLPPLGLWLAAVLDAGRVRALRTVAAFYAAAAAGLCAWIAIDGGVIGRSVCETVLARYFPVAPFEIAYGIFYHTGILGLVFGCGLALAQADDAVARKHLANLQLGVLGFVFPSLAVRLLFSGPGPGDPLPSVMCHFALVLALSLVALVARERRSVPGPEAA